MILRLVMISHINDITTCYDITYHIHRIYIKRQVYTLQTFTIYTETRSKLFNLCHYKKGNSQYYPA